MVPGQDPGWLRWGQSPATVCLRVPLTTSVYPPQGSSQWPAAMCDCHQSSAGAVSLPAPLGGPARLGKATGDSEEPQWGSSLVSSQRPTNPEWVTVMFDCHLKSKWGVKPRKQVSEGIYLLHKSCQHQGRSQGPGTRERSCPHRHTLQHGLVHQPCPLPNYSVSPSGHGAAGGEGSEQRTPALEPRGCHEAGPGVRGHRRTPDRSVMGQAWAGG